MNKQFDQKLTRLFADARAVGHRRLLVISGSKDWARDTLQYCLVLAGDRQCSSIGWLGDEPIEGASRLLRSHHSDILGIDVDYAVIDAWSGLDPDALGQLAGTLKGGGVLFLLCPDFTSWPQYEDPDYRRYRAERPLPYTMSGGFLQRLVALLNDVDADMRPLGAVLHQGRGVVSLGQAGGVVVAPATSTAQAIKGHLRATAEQARIINAITGTQQQASAALLVEADRGRGKSVALGLSAAQLAERGGVRIAVTAPSRASVQNLFAAAGDSAQQVVQFYAVDRLLLDPPGCDLLLVDEAAGFPVPVLAKLLKQYPRIVFSTTLHGYEGSGRGFQARFKQLLQQRRDPWQCLQLHQPIRWAPNDPLEAFVNRLLLIDSTLDKDAGNVQVPAGNIELRKLTQAGLLRDESLLRKVFGLLVSAHYQTRPSDLRYLLDVPYVHLWLAQAGDDVVGVLLACEEGGLDVGLAGAIARGRRRPQGNLLAQSLSLVTGDSYWAEQQSLRVMRIAVSHASRRKGIASALLSALAQFARDKELAYWGSSFGVQADLLSFWSVNDALPLHLGLRLDKASGARNAMVVAALNESCRQRMATRRAQLLRDLPHWQEPFMPELEPECIEQLLRPDGVGDPRGLELPTSGQEDRSVARRFVDGEIIFELAYPALCRLQQQAGPVLPITGASVEAMPDWASLAGQLGLSGKRAAVEAVRAELSGWLLPP